MAVKKRPNVSLPSYVSLPGSKRELLPNSRPAGSIDPSEITSITVRVRPSGKPGDLEKRMHAIYRHPLKDRQYLSHEELARQHGARTQNLNDLQQFALRHNLPVSHPSAA